MEHYGVASIESMHQLKTISRRLWSRLIATIALQLRDSYESDITLDRGSARPPCRTLA